MGRKSIVVAAWMVMAACGNTDLTTTSSVPPVQICNPGSETACTCQSGANGTKACTNNGQAFADCVCNASPDGGVVPVATERSGGDPGSIAPSE
jgi:hypothetical protein